MLNMIYNHTTYSLSPNDLKMVRSIPEGGNWKNIPESIPSKRLERIRETGGRTTLYGRLSLDKPSYTITTYFNRPGNGTYIHPLQDRTISAREAARFQSFPDSYVFEGSKTSFCKQIGNAVPPLLAYSIAKQIKKETGTTRVLDLFSGAGGLSLGFQWAGYKIIAANDNFSHAAKTYKTNHRETCFIEGDIRDIEVQERILNFSKKVDIVIGGPPCQGFSHAGKRMIDDPRNSLYKEFVKIVKSVKPKVFLLENVEGILTINEGKTFKEVKENFSSLGYVVTGHKMHAVAYGVPQKRKRVVIIGVLNGNPEKCYPSPLLTVESKYINTYDAIGDLFNINVNQNGEKVPLKDKPRSVFQQFVRGLIGPDEYHKRLG